MQRLTLTSMLMLDPSKIWTWQVITLDMTKIQKLLLSLVSLNSHNKLRVSLTQAEHIYCLWRHAHDCSSTPCTQSVKMLSQKLTRITLKMSDFEEYEQLKRERERAMDTSQSTPAGSRDRKASKSASHMTGGIEGRRPVRASTPESPPN